MKHVNIPIFIPHMGCPNLCVFCDQRSISGKMTFDETCVREEIEKVLATIQGEVETEIAFFGGSFTGIDRELMITLLKTAHSYVTSGRVHSIRCSTRPDYIDEEILEILAKYGVRVIELGLQSVSDRVLGITKRGHNKEDCARACKLIKQRGFSLVGQMMIGLPGSTVADESETADFIISVGANAARIYPTVVFRDTELCSMCDRGEYKPLSIDEAVTRSAAVLRKLRRAEVDVIRIGLCASENLADDATYFAGPNHPALGELIESELYYQGISEKMSEYCGLKNITVIVRKGELSKAIGQHRSNKTRLINEFGLSGLKFREDESVPRYEFKLEVEGIQ